MPSWFSAVLLFLNLVDPPHNPVLDAVRFLIAIPVAAVGYRLRGGGYVTLPGTFAARAVWGFILGACYLLAFSSSIFSLVPAAVVGVLGYFSVALVPHAYCQNMGRWPTPQTGWPSFFIPEPSPETWTAWPQWRRTAYDFASMFCVGVVRGLIVFAPSVVFWGAINAIIGVFGIALLQALAYLVGYMVPFSLPSVLAKTNEWGEFLTGAAWILALGLARIV